MVLYVRELYLLCLLVGEVVCWLLNVPATCECISGMMVGEVSRFNSQYLRKRNILNTLRMDINTVSK